MEKPEIQMRFSRNYDFEITNLFLKMRQLSLSLSFTLTPTKSHSELSTHKHTLTHTLLDTHMHTQTRTLTHFPFLSFSFIQDLFASSLSASILSVFCNAMNSFKAKSLVSNFRVKKIQSSIQERSKVKYHKGPFK